MRQTTRTRTVAASLFVAVMALALLRVPVAQAGATGSSGMVAAKLGSPDPRGTADERDRWEFRRPMRPDGPALRAAFDSLTAHASRGRAAKASPIASRFSWRDAGIGGGVGFLAAVALACVLALTTEGRKKLAGA